ncbi:MAG TPA: ATP-binding protein, partial [Verrucomicrobiae bacterium]|nr:ATP-binding protein [Verrucomicrobiae bacterium]
MNFIPKEFRAAYREYDRELTIRKTRLGCLIGVVLVPLFAFLDFCLYPRDVARSFLWLRLLCSALMAGLYPLLGNKWGRKYYRAQGILILLAPAATIAWMIHTTGGAASPYYAGLNLVLLVLAVVLDWTFWQSVVSVFLVLLLYLGACVSSFSSTNFGLIINNLFFLISTEATIIAGAYFHTRIRIREFISRCEIEKNKQELEDTNRKLVEMDRFKSRFFANVSHELRTPLTLMLSPLESLLRRFDRSFDGNARDMLVTMQANGMRLLKLINDLLDLIRLEAGRMEVKNEALEVSGFIKGLAAAVKQVAEDKSIALETQIDPELDSILTDRDKLEKIVLNLLFNALKFTPPKGRVWLRAEKKEEHFILAVSDTGVGIAEKNLPFVFDRFWQADSSSKRKFQGVGIGLALVKELVEMMRGTVAVESQEGKGATFIVRLPYQKAEAPSPLEAGAISASENGAAAASEEWLANLYRRAEFFPAGTALPGNIKSVALGNQRPVVLVADDEPDMRRFLVSELDKDYEVIEAADGLKAFEKAEQFLPDIILLDMMMPEMDGLEVCRELRK